MPWNRRLLYRLISFSAYYCYYHCYYSIAIFYIWPFSAYCYYYCCHICSLVSCSLGCQSHNQWCGCAWRNIVVLCQSLTSAGTECHVMIVMTGGLATVRLHESHHILLCCPTCPQQAACSPPPLADFKRSARACTILAICAKNEAKDKGWLISWLCDPKWHVKLFKSVKFSTHNAVNDVSNRCC